MSDRNTFITHRGREILFVDFSNLGPAEFVKAVDEGRQFLLGLNRGNLLLLYDVTHSKAGPETVDVLKEGAKATRPFVRKRAVVGVVGVQRILLNAIKAFSHEDIKQFDNLEQAKDWLVGD
ncbi:MAG: hypothetical protein QME74_09220 [Candidatus Edwardsbacteria bacterium]|nr:hypothetical protein [Candidatus Edwardsbacteria bacterium]